MRPGLLELAAILRSRISQEFHLGFPFRAKLTNPHLLPSETCPSETYIYVRKVPGNGDLDTSTTSLSLIFNQPLLSSLFTSVSLHTTFLLIKQKNRLPSDRSISAPYTLQSTSSISHRSRHRRQDLDQSIV